MTVHLRPCRRHSRMMLTVTLPKLTNLTYHWRNLQLPLGTKDQSASDAFNNKKLTICIIDDTLPSTEYNEVSQGPPFSCSFIGTISLCRRCRGQCSSRFANWNARFERSGQQSRTIGSTDAWSSGAFQRSSDAWDRQYFARSTRSCYSISLLGTWSSVFTELCFYTRGPATLFPLVHLLSYPLSQYPSSSFSFYPQIEPRNDGRSAENDEWSWIPKANEETNKLQRL